MECPHCQTSNLDNAAVCSLCGQFLIQKKATPPPGPAAPPPDPAVETPEQSGNWGTILLVLLGIVAAFMGKIVFCAYFFIAAVFVVYRIKNAE